MLFYVTYFSRTLLICVFLLAIAGTMWSKKSRRSFKREVSNIPFLPRRMSPAVAATVVLLELAIVALLMTGGTAHGGLILALALLTAFTVSLLTTNRGDWHSSCNCFGALERTTRQTALVRNALLLAAAALGLLGVAAPPPPEYTGATVVAVQVVAGVAVLTWRIASPLIDALLTAPATGPPSRIRIEGASGLR